MDRRKLVLTGLTAGAGLVAKGALAQTPLPPAQPYPQDGPPPGQPPASMPPPPSNQPA
jgi:hypothetical protein